MGVYRFLPMVIAKNKKDGYRNEPLERLKKYDQENQSNLLYTLEVFLDSVGKIGTVSERLYIHPNTLNYRLKRISEVGGINLDNANQRTALFIDLKCIKFYDE
jgi:DNA-binding PucR family transcriptional regulator